MKFWATIGSLQQRSENSEFLSANEDGNSLFSLHRCMFTSEKTVVCTENELSCSEAKPRCYSTRKRTFSPSVNKILLYNTCDSNATFGLFVPMSHMCLVIILFERIYISRIYRNRTFRYTFSESEHVLGYSIPHILLFCLIFIIGRRLVV